MMSESQGWNWTGTTTDHEIEGDGDGVQSGELPLRFPGDGEAKERNREIVSGGDGNRCPERQRDVRQDNHVQVQIIHSERRSEATEESFPNWKCTF